MIFEKFEEFLKHNPDTLDLIDIDPTRVQRDTIAGNLQNLPQAEKLASQYNQFSTDQLLKALERMMPGYGALRDSVTSNIGSMVRGEIPKDVEQQLQRRAAEKGITLGTAGSNFQSYDALRNLGLTSLDITRQGLGAAASWVQSAPRAPQFDIASMMFTPQQRLAFEFQQAQANVPIRSFNNWVNTLQKPWERFLSAGLEELGSFADMGAGYLTGGAGGIMKMFGGGGGMNGSGGTGSVNPSPGGPGYSSDFYNYGPQ